MKYLYLSLFFLWMAGLPAPAQITLTRASFPSVGDTLYTSVDNLPNNIGVTAAGADQRWDLSGLQAPYIRRIAVREPAAGTGSGNFAQADLLMSLGEQLEAYFQSEERRLLLLGFFGYDPLEIGLEALARFQPHIVERNVPLRYLDSNESTHFLSISFATDDLPGALLDQLPITPDSLRIRLQGERFDVVDAWGKVIIPGGIYDVLREKRTETREVRLDAKLGFLPWQDITELVPNIEGLGNTTTVQHHFLSNEAKEPIAIVTLDETQTRALRVEYKANDLTTDIQSLNSLKPGVYAFPNPAIVNVRFEFSNLPAGNYTLTIYNILGMEMWSANYFINGNHIEKVNISDLQKGTYLYSLTDERGKTIMTKRLLVVKP